jgi:putative SOS response-associated peptidase YedK
MALGDVGECCTLLTTESGPDAAPIHDRQMVALRRADRRGWLDFAKPETELLQPLPASNLAVQPVP